MEMVLDMAKTGKDSIDVNRLDLGCKYTMPQGEISLDLKATKRKAILSLKDNGIGIPKKAKKHIFSDIYRAENARQSQEELSLIHI